MLNPFSPPKGPHDEAPGIAPPRPLLAALLSLPFPGLGHVRAGRAARGVAWAVLRSLILLPSALLMLWPGHEALGGALTTLGGGLFYPLVALDAARCEDQRAAAAPRALAYLGLVPLFFLLGTGGKWLGREALFTTVTVGTTDMAPSIERGDELLVNRVAYGLRLPRFGYPSAPSPELGDVILAKFPEPNPVLRLYRVVAFPGQTVSVIDGALRVDGVQWPTRALGERTLVECTGEELEVAELEVQPPSGEPFTIYQSSPGPSLYKIEPVTVPEGQVYVIGDNRAFYYDSTRFGLLPTEHIQGRVEVILNSQEPSTPAGRLWRFAPVH